MSHHSFTIGSYVPGRGYLYKMDPRSKIFATIIFMISVFFIKDIYFMLGALGLVLLIMISGRINLIKAINGLKTLIILAVFIFIFQVLFNQTGDIVYTSDLSFSLLSIGVSLGILILWIFTSRLIKLKSIYFILMVTGIYLSFVYIPSIPSNYYTYTLNIYSEGLLSASFVLVRLIIVVFIASILTLTTKPTDLTMGLEWYFRPLKIFKINSEEIALIITIALRYIPTIVDEAEKIMDAQASRGADFKEGSLRRKISQIVSLLVPMFVISFERSDELADAMLSRNYVPGKTKTRYRTLKFKLLDLFSLIFSILILGGSICLFIML